MKPTFRNLAWALTLSACSLPTLPTAPMLVQDATKQQAIQIGKNGKAEVRATMGVTREIAFDNGYEVWLYQFDPSTAGSTKRDERVEFVVLFDPTGRVTKTRTRDPAPSMAAQATTQK